MKTILIFVLSILCVATLFSQQTAIPDPNFEQALINEGYDSPPIDGYVPTANISSVTQLWVTDMGIADLTGIEDFSSLHLLQCMFNYLTSLDLSQNTQLTDLHCYNNQLTELDLSNNLNLLELMCSENQLTNINISGCSNLEYIACVDNELTELDISNNLDLEIIACGYNELSHINVSNHSRLEHLYAEANQLDSLDISSNPLMKRLWCNSNQLNYLNVKNGNNVNFTEFHAAGNPDLECIQVDNVEWAESNWGDDVDPLVVFSLDCETVDLHESIYNIIDIYPNPSSSSFTIDLGDLKGLSMKITNLYGQIIMEKNNIHDPTFSFTVNGSCGMYTLVLKHKTGIYYYKLLKR